MFNLFDIMRGAQGGAAIDNMSRQFGITPAQTQKAVEALLPAFTMGLQRSAMNPNALGQLFGMLGSGQHAGFFDNPAQSFSPQAQAQGNNVLAQLFGSPDVSRQVATQAAAMTGIGTGILKQMLPYLAAMLIGGLFRSASSQGLGGAFTQIGEMLRQAQAPGAGFGFGHPGPSSSGSGVSGPGSSMGAPFGVPQGPAAATPPPGGPWAGPFGPMADLLGSMFAGVPPGGQGAAAMGTARPGTAASQPQPPPDPASFAEAWAKLFGMGVPPPGAATQPAPGQAYGQGRGPSHAAQGSPPGGQSSEARPAAAPPPNPAEMWGQMFQTGREVQEQQIKGLQSIFDTVWGARPPSR